jgi:hypothetical protein
MRTPISRFAAFGGMTSADFEGFPTVQPAVPAPARNIGGGPDGSLSMLERHHPAVVRSLTLLWGYPEMNQYFEKVWSGQDPSLNLEPAAMSELMMLAAIHQRICPYKPACKVEEMYGAGRWADTWKPARLRR